MDRLTHKVSISAEVISQEVDGETVLLDLKSETYFGLNQVGSRIWQLLKDNGDIALALSTMLEEYDVDPERLNEDVQNLVDQLVEAGLITLNN